MTKVRLVDRCGLEEGKDFEVQGVPRTVEGTRDLWERDKYQFQKWAVEQVDGFYDKADCGVDGRLNFGVPGRPKTN